MRVAKSLALPLLFAFLSGCGSNPGAGGSPSEGNGSVNVKPPAYSGPELTATIETMESHPPQYAALVEINCPTGGYELSAQPLDSKGGVRMARLVLVAPGADDMVTQAFERKTVRVELGAERTPVQIMVAQHRRNEPMTAPFALATTVTPK